MKKSIVTRTSVFPSPINVVFNRLKELNTLQYIAAPLATFTPLNGAENLVWRKDEDFKFRFKLFNILPFGIHTIHVVEFDEGSCGIYTHETNTHVPIWNHRILLKSTGAGETQYTDEVEIYAGWKTPLVYLWAKFFYAHRQKKWIKLLQHDPTGRA